MRYLVAILLFVLALTIPALAKVVDTTKAYQPMLNKWLIIDMSSADSPREKTETLNFDGSLATNAPRDAYSFNLEPLAISAHQHLLVSALSSGNVGKYLLLGTSFNYELSNNTGIKFSASVGYEFTANLPSFGASFLFITNWGEYTGLTTEVDFKSNGSLSWYHARVSAHIIPAISLGIRSQKNSLTGPYIHLGNEDWAFLWISYGVGDDFKSLGMAAGVRITSTMFE